MSNYKINFNYQGNALPAKVAPLGEIATQPNVEKVNSACILSNQYSFSDINTESAGRVLLTTSSLKELLSNNKLTYSDSSTSYELDA
jgi:hypothetical protein